MKVLKNIRSLAKQIRRLNNLALYRQISDLEADITKIILENKTLARENQILQMRLAAQQKKSPSAKQKSFTSSNSISANLKNMYNWIKRGFN